MKTIALLLAPVLLLSLGGCIQLQNQTTLNGDGSGTVSLDYTMSTEVEGAFKELQTLDGGMNEDMGEVPMFDESFDKAALESKLKENGAKLTAFSNSVADGQRKVHIEISFKNPEGMEAALGGALAAGGALGLFKNQDGDYVLKGVPTPEAEGEDEADEAPAQEDMAKAMENAQKSMAIMGKLMAHMNEISMDMRITVPGDVLSHNAHTLDGRTCIWHIDSSNMMSAQGMDEPEIVFSGKGLNIAAPNY
ncbi:MAG TPA: hypothetical protein P5571_08400 [Candidatus Krumholzibacteria bacterium]|nr:hypothetical protein [Candidatus Krumholzibacteria bacterium]HRX51366.1 hypothetical protein [Candidatus Krumholzibacteria bacterium]